MKSSRRHSRGGDERGKQRVNPSGRNRRSVSRPTFSSALKSQSRFSRFARWASRTSGQPAAFIGAVAALLIWSASGPMAGYSDTWQLIINTGTTIVTFLMVFLIQNTQNRDSEAMHLKLDELLRASSGADKALLDLEELEEEDLNHLRREYEALAERARGELRRRQDEKGE